MSGKADRVSEAGYDVRVEKRWIVVSDGTRLAATLYLPDGGGSSGARFPALFEFLPYRKDDFYLQPSRYDYFARRGYVAAQVDVRGTGGSDGIADDQYSVQEGADAVDVIGWLAAQSWCNGNVGMWGISYGGFNAIQVAMLRPPALKAIIAAHATDDVYTDDIMYWNGALQLAALTRYPTQMIWMNMLPPSPDYEIESETARARFENPSEPWLFKWLSEQRDGPYWRRSSLRPNYEAIEVPTMLIGGWLDGYVDSVPRMLEKMDAPTRAIIGPWPHTWPEAAQPGPRVDGLHETLRWWDQWLKGIDTGVLDEPRVAYYLQDYYPHRLDVEEIPGEWRASNTWPPAGVNKVAWYPDDEAALSPQPPGDERAWELHYQPTVGTSSQYRTPWRAQDLPGDQRSDDAHSLSFTSGPLEQPLEIVGFPRAILFAEASAPVAHWIVRLSDIAPDGSSKLVSKGILNGTHRDSHSIPETLEPATVYELTLELKATAWRFSTGHRIRFSISNADFPVIWPTPYPMATRLHSSGRRPTRLLLPVLAREAPSQQPSLKMEEPAETNAPPRSGATETWKIEREPIAQTTSISRTMNAQGEHDSVPRISSKSSWNATARDDHPAATTLSCESEVTIDTGDVIIVACASLTLTSDESDLHVTARRTLQRNGQTVRNDTREAVIPRDHT